MHGRLKVKTTEQQEKEKKVERAAKLKSYRQAMDTILLRRSEGHKDETQLKISAQVLQSNPDITTLWNIRKEILLHLFEKPVVEDEQSIDKDTRLNKELDLTQACLMINPKSYGAWYHRTWSLEHMDRPNWKKELALCNKYLQLDERNFHCWDYRKWVAAQAKVSCQDELEFTMEKIGENFSNYSAWHYRSKLLPLLYPGDNNNTIQESTLHSELDLVQNAAFTDPEDSSAWFYHTWLLGKEEEKLSIIYCLIQANTIILAVTRPVQDNQIKVFINDKVVDLSWKGEDERYNSLWKAEILCNSGDILQLSAQEQKLKFSRTENAKQLMQGDGWKSPEERFINLSNEKTETVLKQALDNCTQLLDLEPDSKWTLFTKTLILLALDSHKNHQDIVVGLSKLMKIDSMRKNYYQDFLNRVKTEYRIEQADYDAKTIDQKSDNNVIYHSQYFPAFQI